MSATMSGRFPLKFAKIDYAAGGDSTIVAAVPASGVRPAMRIRVISCQVTVGGATSIKFKSAAVDITGAMPLAANGGFNAMNEEGCFETIAAAALVINSSGVAQVGGWLTYVELP